MFRNKFLALFVGISLFLVAYLYYVKQERLQSIVQYFNEPRKGDIYKIEKENKEGTPLVHYWKVVEVHPEHVTFVSSTVSTLGSIDYLQRNFETERPFTLSRRQLQEIKNGDWNNLARDFTQLIEIKRKHGK